VASFDALHCPAVHAAFAGRPYDQVVAICGHLAEALSARTGVAISPDALLIDAPPAEREVEFKLQVRERTDAGGLCWRRLEDLSPVVRSLAHEQFDDLVKRVRVFVAADVADAIRGCGSLDDLLLAAAETA